MRKAFGCAMVLALALGAGTAAPKGDASWATANDDPKLPRVLLIGDSISLGYEAPVRELLAGKANVHHPPDNCQSTVYGLEHIDEWLADGHWDVIHFNWGIWDNHHMEDGRLRTTPEQYEKNLNQLVARLKRTGAKLVWATTTPIETLHHNALWVQSTYIPIYNDVSKQVMRAQGIPVDDLYAAVLPRIGELRADDGVHYTPAGSKFLAERVAQSIERALGKPAARSRNH